MCSACALTAMAGATGLRAWVAIHVPALATRRRLRAVTVLLLTGGVLLASVSLRGSAPAEQAQVPPAAAQAGPDRR